MSQLFTLIFIVKYCQSWEDDIVAQLVHAWNCNRTVGLSNHDDKLIAVCAGIEHHCWINVWGGIIIPSRFDSDIKIEFIHDICRYQPLLCQLLYIFMFQGMLSIDQDVMFHVIIVFQVDISEHIQFCSVRQFRQFVQVNDSILTELVQIHVFIIVQVVLLCIYNVHVYIHVLL